MAERRNHDIKDTIVWRINYKEDTKYEKDLLQ